MPGLTSTRQKAGHRAKRAGEVFERAIEFRAAYQKLSIIKIPDGCKRVNGPRGLKLIPVFTPFDYILFSDGYGITFDAKTVDQNTFAYSQIERHQVASLLRCAENALRSGYIIWFRPLDLVSFVTVKTLKSVNPRQSITPEHGIILGKGSGFDLKKLFEMREIKSHLISLDSLPIE